MTRPLTREELDEIERETFGRTFIGPITLARFIAQCRRALDLEEQAALEKRRDEWLERSYTMRDADIERLWQQVTDDVRSEATPIDFVGRMADPREVRKRFARACEQHGIERAKALAEVSESDGWHKVEPYIDWSALDAEIAKENEP